MDTESYTSNDFRKRIEQLSKSLENRIKSKQNKSKFYFTEEDDEILDSNAIELSSEPGTWLYVSEQCSTTEEQRRLGNHTLESMSAMLTDDVSSVINQSRRSFDSRTYTRPKKPPPSSPFITSQDSSSTTFRTDCTKPGSPYLHPFGGPHMAHLNYSTDTMESSLGIIDINNLTESQQLDFEKASMERSQSSSPPQSLEALNVTYDKNHSTLCIASDGPLNSTFTLQEHPENSPPSARQNSKFAKNCLPEPTYNSKLTRNQLPDSSNVGYSSKLTRNQPSNTDKNSTFDKNQFTDLSNTPQNSKFINSQLPDPSTVTINSKFTKNEPSITLNSKYTRSQSPETPALSYSSKFVRNHSPEPSPFWQNSKFPKKPISESTPIVKNSRFNPKFTTNNHCDDLDDGDIEETNGDLFSSTHSKDRDDIMSISFPSMMQSSTSIQSDSESTFEVNPNTTIDKKRSSFGAGRFKNVGDASTVSCEEDANPNVTIENRKGSEFNSNLTIDKRRGSEVNPNLTIEKRRISLGRCETMKNTGEPDIDPNTPIERRSNFKVNPNLTIDKRRTSLGQGSTTENSDVLNFEVNPNSTIEKISNFEVNPNTTIDRTRSTLGRIRSSNTTERAEDPNLDNFEADPLVKRSNFEVNPNTAIEKRSDFEVNPNTTIEIINNSEVNPYLTIDKRKSTTGQQSKSSSTENVIVNNLNANYQECLKNSERIQALRDRLGGAEEVPSKNLTQITPPHSEEFLGEPVSFSTPSRDVKNQKLQKSSSAKLTNGGCSADSSSTECEEISPVSMEDAVSPRASSVPPLDGTFCKSGGDHFSKKGAKLLEGGASPLNSTFRKQALSSTFCKSAETLNNGAVGVGGGGGGSVESGPDEDGMSTASDSSFSSSSTHMRSVGEIQSIARLQEESLSLQNNTALRKIAWGGSDSGDGDLTKGNQTAFRKQATMSDDGNQSDHSSERCSPSSERCSPTALNNNLRNVSRLSLRPLSSYGRTGGLSMQHARSVEQLPSALSLARSKQSTFGLKRPTVVSKQPLNNTTTSSLQQQQPPPPPPPSSMAPPSSRLQAPSAANAAAPSKPSGIRPPTAIPRPVSRLPAPKIKTGLPRYNGKSSGQL